MGTGDFSLGAKAAEAWSWPATPIQCRIKEYMELYLHYLYHSFATRVSQLKIWHFCVIGIERNVCRCTFNRYSVITQLAKLAAGEQLCRRCTHRKL